MRLSNHFTLAELCKSHFATRHGIINEPDDEQIEALVCLSENILEPIRVYYGIPYAPSSGFRGSELNRRLGGVSHSQHRNGEAADLELPGVDNMELAKWIEGNLEFDQLILEYYKAGEPASGWVHVSYAQGNNRGEVLSKDREGYQSGLYCMGEQL